MIYDQYGPKKYTWNREIVAEMREREYEIIKRRKAERAEKKNQTKEEKENQ